MLTKFDLGMKNSVKQTIETITLSAQVAISKCENQMEYVQVLPENPRKGLVKPFSGRGHVRACRSVLTAMTAAPSCCPASRGMSLPVC